MRDNIEMVAELRERGFVVLRRAVAAERMARLAAAYDEAMAAGSGQDLSVGITTTRLHGLVHCGAAFDEVYTYAPLLEAAADVIGGRFKLSSMMGRTLRAGVGAQKLHVDLAHGSAEAPMVGFILMVDDFRTENGATRFVPGSHEWAEAPEDVIGDLRSVYQAEVLACGSAGSMIVFNASIWHGHTANVAEEARRSIQGYFVRRDVASHLGWVTAETLARIGPVARVLLAVDDDAVRC